MFQALSTLSPEGWIGLAVIAGLAIWIFGLITNFVLKGRGFGVLVNGVFVSLGFLAGAAMRLGIFGKL